MLKQLPESLVQVKQSRLAPVRTGTSKERRTTSIVLACKAKVDEIGEYLFGILGQGLAQVP